MAYVKLGTCPRIEMGQTTQKLLRIVLLRLRVYAGYQETLKQTLIHSTVTVIRANFSNTQITTMVLEYWKY